MRVKQVIWDSVSDDDYIVAETELGLDMWAYIREYKDQYFQWAIQHGRTLIRSGEEETEYMAKQSCVNMWEDVLRSFFEESEGCHFCLTESSIDDGRASIYILNENTLHIYTSGEYGHYDGFGNFIIRYCPLCGRKLKLVSQRE